MYSLVTEGLVGPVPATVTAFSQAASLWLLYFYSTRRREQIDRRSSLKTCLPRWLSIRGSNTGDAHSKR